MFKEKIATAIADYLQQPDITSDHVLSLVERPKDIQKGDFSVPCFSFSKLLKRNPKEIAEDIAGHVQLEGIGKIEALNGFLNFYIDKASFSESLFQEIIAAGPSYASSEEGKGKVITIDLSSPNIAKPFSMGHLRSTIIGHAIGLIASKKGYHVERINHIGDWGTQFGKLIVAYKLWGDEDVVRANPIKELLKLYVRFHEEVEENPELEVQARQWFRKLEEHDKEAVELWTWFTQASLDEFRKIYELLGIEFDTYSGESFYNDKMDAPIKMLEDMNLLERDDNADIVRLDDETIPPVLIRKSDGATLYITRDIAAAIYRKKTYDFYKNIYVVGNEQSLHFQQLRGLFKKMGFDWWDDIIHVPFGMMLKDGKKMSTRKGKVVLLEDVLADSIDMAMKNILEKNSTLENKEDVARDIGVGAVMFYDLKNYRLNDIEFDLERMLQFEGETGPYVQYTYARANSILDKLTEKMSDKTFVPLEEEEEWELTNLLSRFEEELDKSFRNLDPSIIAKYVLELSRVFNRYYGRVRFLDDEAKMYSRHQLIESMTIVIKESMRLLGINVPKNM